MINSNYFHLIVFLLAVGTILIRGSFIFFAGRLSLTSQLRNLFSFIPAAIFPALVIPTSYYHESGPERLIALLISVVFCFFVRNMLAVILLGLVTLYLLKYVLG